MAFPYQDLICYSIAGLLIPTALWLGWWSLLRDRARGRRRCPKCWYDLRGTPGMQCSECGFTARRERQFSRTRRFRRVALMSFILFAAGLWLGLTPVAHRYGLLAFVPRPILVLMSAPGSLDFRNENPNKAYWAVAASNELMRRKSARSLSSWELDYLLQSKNVLLYRKKWPIGIPLIIGVDPPLWLSPVLVRLDADLPNAKPAWIGFGPFPPRDGFQLIGILTAEAQQEVGTPAHDRRGVAVSWRTTKQNDLSRGFPTDSAAVDWLRSGAIDLQIDIVPSVDDVFPTRHDDALDAEVRNALRVSLMADPQSTSVPLVHIQLDRTVSPRMRDLAFGFHVELLKDNHQAYSVTVSRNTLAAGPPALSSVDRDISVGEGRFHQFEFAAVTDLEVRKHWQVRVTGHKRAALLDIERNTFWSGEQILSFDEALAPAPVSVN